MHRLLAHNGVDHVTDLESANHASSNSVPVILLLSGLVIAAGVIIYWLLSRQKIAPEEKDET